MGTHAPHPEDVRLTNRTRVVWARMLLGAGIALAIGATIVPTSFVAYRVTGCSDSSGAPMDLLLRGYLPDLVVADARWAVAAGTTALLPAIHLLWRRTGASWARWCGFASAVLAAGSIWLIPYVSAAESQAASVEGGGFRAFGLAGWLLAAAFLVAPPPRNADEIDPLTVRRLLRRHGRADA